MMLTLRLSVSSFKYYFVSILLIFFFMPQVLVSGNGEVYLVLGSDTAIWEGMNVGRYHCFYNIDLYTNPTRNAYLVMEPSFRQQFVDSYGQPVKMTWWMMAGNIFRYADNKNVPLPNIMTLHLMKKYHGDTIRQNGDELSLHYHTFAWTDYDGDGKYWWNQSLTFPECREDLDFTLAQFLLEENIFPVSFRSGWHYMDNDWQQYLNEILPYSLHNDWPNKRIDTTEPLDNTYDWSLAPEAWIPYHPSPDDYQVPGQSKGWNVRSDHMSSFTQPMMDKIFEQANQGIDQVACIWAHLPESDFLENIEKVNDLAHKAATKYSNVRFRYCTAIEAMKRWQKTNDNEAPVVTFEERPIGDEVSFVIETDEPVFQTQPYIVVKNIYENYFVVPCYSIGLNKWQSNHSLQRNQLAKAGVAVCDTVGNLATKFICFLPDDIYVDNTDVGYIEESGNWSTSSISSWGQDSRVANLAENDTARTKWAPYIEQSGYYHNFVQIPSIENTAEKTIFKIYSNGVCVDTTIFTRALPTMDWVYIGTAFFTAKRENYLEMAAYGDGQVGKTLAADVAKFSALTPERDLYVAQNFIDLGEVSLDDTVSLNLKVTNRGFHDLTLFNVSSVNRTLTTQMSFPIIISGMSDTTLFIQFFPQFIGIAADTLLITSDDPVDPTYKIPVNANVQTYFVIIDNEDSLYYKEEGNWRYSVAQAYGLTSRFSFLYEGPGANARFNATLTREGVYEIFEIVPRTENATNHAVYILSISNVVVDSIVIDQNQGSGDWISLGRYFLPARLPIEIKVIDTGESTAGDVLRADAIKFYLIQEISNVNDYAVENNPLEFQLKQNYPNPFNSETMIKYQLKANRDHVSFEIFNLLGEKVTSLVNEDQQQGEYQVSWDGKDNNGNNVASGIYIYKLSTGEFNEAKRMILVR